MKTLVTNNNSTHDLRINVSRTQPNLNPLDNLKPSSGMCVIREFTFFTHFDAHHPFISESIIDTPPCFWVGVEHMFDNTSTFSRNEVVEWCGGGRG